ncbi:MAG: DUF5011 domain-containing protein [Bacteroidetes bacterium]|nr:DUF5011 domain-containing protein [Bacteroidota bacterium]
MKKIIITNLILFCIILFACKKDKGSIPVITLLGNNPTNSGVGYPYIDAGATAHDSEDGDLTSKILTTSNVDTSTVGNYTVRYNVTDKDGNKADEVTRQVIIKYFK